MISVQYLIDRLNAPVTMSMFATKTDLYMDILEQRKEAASILHQQEERIASLDANITRLTGNPVDHRYWEGRYRDAEARVKVLEEAIDKIADFDDPDAALDLNVVHLIRIAGAARRDARSDALKSEGEI